MNKNKRNAALNLIISGQEAGTIVGNIATSGNKSNVCLVPGVSLLKSIPDWIVQHTNMVVGFFLFHSVIMDKIYILFIFLNAR